MLRPYPNLAMFAGLLLIFPIATVAQSTPTVLCIPGQCLQGYSNTTIGATLSNPALPLPIHILPGTYSATTSPQLLHDALTSTSTTLSATVGFGNVSSISLPLDLALQSGLSVYPGSLYSGSPNYQILPNVPIVNTSARLSSRSFVLSSNLWIVLNTGPSNDRIIVWDAIPDTSQLPSGNQGSLALTDLQSSACNPSCSATGGTCSATGICQCLSGFTGASCESCATGSFGPKCLPCPSNCSQCDEGINGSGRCLKPIVANDPASCNCRNGVCAANGQCTCNPGFTTGNNGTACSKCAPGFFQTSTGDCQVCQIGCTTCADGSGACQTCKPGFSRDANDATKCNPPAQATNSGVVCPSGSFSNGTSSCAPCASACQTCTGPASTDCIVCASGLFTLNGACVSANADGICQGSNLIADNNKRECDTCGAKCTKCRIPNFTVASTVNQKQCTECLPGSFLNRGTCVDSCPTGTTVSAQDNRTCIACDPSCTTCSGNPTFCLTCTSNRFSLDGKCVSACPSGTFSTGGACLPCHPDCASCSSGGAFNQCTSCIPSRPVLSNGRCLPTCAKNHYFDKTGGTCRKCDDTCSSCSSAGPSNCLACLSSGQVLRAGTCVTAGCGSVVPGLGVCLSELVATKSTDPSAPPLPSVSGINTPTIVVKKRLEWWQILLMALGCAFIFVGVLWCCRRRQQKKKRTERTEMFAIRSGGRQTSWRWRLIKFLQGLFGREGRQRRVTTIKPGVKIVHLGPVEQEEGLVLDKLRAAEEARAYYYTLPPKLKPSTTMTTTTTTVLPKVEEEDMVRLIGSYNRPPSPRPERNDHHHHHHYRTDHHQNSRCNYRDNDDDARSSMSDVSSGHSRMSAPSLYSQLTGMPRKAPEPKMPVKRAEVDLLTSRFSGSTFSSAERRKEVVSSKKKTPFLR